MEENKERIKIVVDTNVLFSALLSEDSLAKAILSILKSEKKIKLLIPMKVFQEIDLHIGELSRKSRVPIRVLKYSFEYLTDNFEKIDEGNLEKELKDGLRFVNDESDAPFVAIALINKPCYILTYNIRDFKREELKKEGIIIVSPNEMLEIMGVRKLDINSLMKRKGNITRYLLKWLEERKL